MDFSLPPAPGNERKQTIFAVFLCFVLSIHPFIRGVSFEWESAQMRVQHNNEIEIAFSLFSLSPLELLRLNCPLNIFAWCVWLNNAHSKLMRN